MPEGRGVVHLPCPMKSNDLMQFAIHSSCCHNHIDALTRRVALCVPVPDQDLIRRLRLVSKQLGKSLGNVLPITRAQVIGMFGGFRRKRYQEAAETLEKDGDYIDSRVKMFVKQEAVHVRADKPNPACRAIQFREPTYSLQLAQYIKPLEHKLYRVRAGKPFPPGQFIAKNLNPRQRAELIQQKMSALPGCTVLELDASRFDAHVSYDLLQVEHACYTQALRDPYFKKLLVSQLNNRGRARGKDFHLSYSLRGGRMSGDMNTASGNCVLMSCMLALFGADHFDKYDFLVDGDDSLFFFVGNMPPESTIKSYFRGFGMTMKIDNVTNSISDLSFCQAKFVQLSQGPTMVRDPFKVMSRTTVNMKFADPRVVPKLLKTIATGELSIVPGCPVLQPYFLMLIRNCDRVMSKRGKRDGGLMRGREWADYRQKRDLPGDWWRVKEQPITAEARKSFALAFGIGIEEQLMLERTMDKFSFDPTEAPTPGLGVDVSRWLPDPFTRECIV